jgi:hypothetical protein
MEFISIQLRESEQICKEQLLLYTEIQLSYINTNHEDFIGFINTNIALAILVSINIIRSMQ